MDSEENAYLTLEQIETAPDVTEEDVDVPVWGGKVRIRGFTKDVEMALREEAKIPGTETEIDRRKLELLYVVHGVVAPTMTEGQIAMLEKKSSQAVNTILRAVMKINGQTPEEVDKRERAFRDGPSAPVPVHPDGETGDSDEEAPATTAEHG